MAEGKGGIKTDNWLTNWMIDRVNSGMTRNSETGEMEPGFWSGTIGSAVGLDVDSIGTTKKKNVETTAANDLIEASTYTHEDLGFKPGQTLTRSGVRSAVKALDEKKRKGEIQETRTYEESIRSGDRRHASETLAATLKANSEQSAAQLRSQELNNQASRDQQNAQYAHTSEQNALTRRHETERGDKRDALSLQMQVMQNDLAEKRMDYDRETLRMDKRSAAIAQLMSGLGSLGGAFSL
jgi:hypothetical protein